MRLFNTLVKPVLLYGSETSKINEGDNKPESLSIFINSNAQKSSSEGRYSFRCFQNDGKLILATRRWDT